MNKLMPGLAVAAIITATLLSACAMPEPPTRTALVYGVSIYEAGEEGVGSNLTYTDDDALALASMLTTQGWTIKKTGISNKDIGNDGTDVTRAAIKAEISALAGTEGLILFYYSGHGTILDGESAICPFGSVPLNISTYDELITTSDLFAMFKSAGLEHVIVILDSCYSGGFIEEGATVDAVPPVFGQNDFDGDIEYTLFVNAFGDALRGYLAYSAGSDYIVISAAGAGELSYEADSPYNHGIFSYFLLRAGGAESGNADSDSDGYVTSSELYAYCAAGIDRYWNATYEDSLDFYTGLYADYLPHLSGTAREYALWAAD